MDLAKFTWQRTQGDNWIFGLMVRGLVRDVLAIVYFDEELTSSKGGWCWKVIGDVGGIEANLQCAVARCETILETK